MNILVYCPVCRERHFLNPEMRGQRTRCKNAFCREVFEVCAEGEAKPAPPQPDKATSPPPASVKNYVAGAIGDLVPLLPSEAAPEPPAPAQPPAKPSPTLQELVPLLPAEPAQHAPPETVPPVIAPARQQAPSVRRPPAPKPSPAPSDGPTPRLEDSKQKPVHPEPAVPPAPGPRELAPGSWQPPPVRRLAPDKAPADDPWAAIASARRTESTEAVTRPEAPRQATLATARFGPILVAACLVLIAGAGFGLVYFLSDDSDEATLRGQAEAALQQNDHRKARDLYARLAQFESKDRGEYEFYRELCRLLVEADATAADPNVLMEQLRQFLQANREQPLLDKNEKNRLKAWDVYRVLVKKACDNAAKTPPEEMAKRLDSIKKWLQEPAYWPEPEPRGSTPDLLGRLEQALARATQLQSFRAKLTDRLQKGPTLRQVMEAEAKAKELRLSDDPDVQKTLAQLLKAATASVAYRKNPSKIPAPSSENAPGLLIAPALVQGKDRVGRGVVFALVRGVLYALAEDDGRALWATRVGIDTTQLPVRLPATETSPELALVLSSDTSTLSARRVDDGVALWQHALGSPCLGRPVIVERRAYVPTVDGRVQEIEVQSGTVLGEFQTGGLTLRLGGTRQPGTNLLYFAADSDFLLVLDVTPGAARCLSVLRTGHSSGSLRSEPIVVADEQDAPAAPPRYLILCQGQGLDRMKLRAWEIKPGWELGATPAREEEVRGWSWFAPLADSEKIALATDTGALDLFGINQRNNKDPAIFRMLPSKTISPGHPGEWSGRAQVVQAADSDFWVLAGGELQHWRLGLHRQEGLKLGSLWPKPPQLGAPLHASQANSAGDTLFLATQSLQGPACLMTAVDAQRGTVRWQRQLGFVAAADPVLLGGQVLALDRAGGLFLFDPASTLPAAGNDWSFHAQLLAAAPKDAAAGPYQFLPDGDGKSVAIIAALGKETLLVRRCLPGKKPDTREVQDLTFRAALAGTLALATGQLVLPLANGTLARVPLQKDKKADSGPDWRATHADPDAQGHVVHLGGDDFLFTNGSTGLYRLTWPVGQPWVLWDAAKKKLEPPRLGRIVAPPLLVPAPAAKSAPRIAVADATGTLTLLGSDRLQKIRSWQLPGPITAGPFLRGAQVGCIVERRLLLWIDPDKDGPAWQYGAPDGAAIVGQPQRLGERLIVAHADGRIVSLDQGRGEPQGMGYQIKGSVAPAAAPVAYGDDRLFVPLTDGTVLLLPVAAIP